MYLPTIAMRAVRFAFAKVVDHLLPAVPGGPSLRKAELLDDDRVHLLVDEGEGDLVDGGAHVVGGDHRLLLHVREQRDLAPQVLVQRAGGAAEQDVGLDADLAQLAHRVLRRLALRLAPVDLRHQGEVDEQHVLLAQVVDELPRRLQEGDRLDVAHRAADLHERHVHAGLLAHAEDARLDLVGDVGDDLHGPAEEPALPLLGDDGLVDLAGGDRVVLPDGGGGEPAVVAQVEVGLRAVVGDVDLAVLVGVHGPRIDVDVGVDLDHADVEAPVFQEAADGRGGDTFSKPRADAAGDENVFAHGDWIIEEKKGSTQRTSRGQACRGIIHGMGKVAQEAGEVSGVPHGKGGRARPPMAWRWYAPFLLTVIAGVAVTLVVFAAFRASEAARLRADFQTMAADRAQAIRAGLSEDFAELDLLASLRHRVAGARRRSAQLLCLGVWQFRQAHPVAGA